MGEDDGGDNDDSDYDDGNYVDGVFLCGTCLGFLYEDKDHDNSYGNRDNRDDDDDDDVSIYMSRFNSIGS